MTKLGNLSHFVGLMLICAVGFFRIINRRNKMKPDKRKTVVVDQKLQYTLARRIIMYWCVTWLLVFVLPIMVRMFTEQVPFGELARQIIADFWFPIAISIFLAPIVVWDSFRFSNRVAGPVLRIGRTIQQMADKDQVETVTLRKNDFCHGLADSVNQLIVNQPAQNDSSYASDGQTKLEPVAH